MRTKEILHTNSCHPCGQKGFSNSIQDHCKHQKSSHLPAEECLPRRRVTTATSSLPSSCSKRRHHNSSLPRTVHSYYVGALCEKNRALDCVLQNKEASSLPSPCSKRRHNSLSRTVHIHYVGALCEKKPCFGSLAESAADATTDPSCCGGCKCPCCSENEY